MDSSATFTHHAKLVPKKCHTFFLTGKHLSSHRTPSFSSSYSSSLSPSSSSLETIYFHDDSLLSPATPLRISGVPFSWEHLPGIPKNQNCKKKHDPPLRLLPLPPPTTVQPSKKAHEPETRIGRKNSIEGSFQRDPFFAAFVECSKSKDDKDHDHEEDQTSRSFWNNGAKVSRCFSDRFGFINLYSSCKRTCAVSESLVLPSKLKK